MALSVSYFRWSCRLSAGSVSFSIANIYRNWSNSGMDNSSTTKLNSSYSKLLDKLAQADMQALNQVEKEIHTRHLDACKKMKESYTDPETGFQVMTSYSHLKRGDCCGNECRHCPYDHVNVPQDKKSKSFNSAFFV